MTPPRNGISQRASAEIRFWRKVKIMPSGCWEWQGATSRGYGQKGRFRAGIREREKTHCPQGHEYTPENTLKEKRGRGCRACRYKRHSERRRKRRAEAA